jgi:tetratricopeptide (TPR) repeat protein
MNPSALPSRVRLDAVRSVEQSRSHRWRAGRAALAAAVLLAYAPVLWNGLVWDDVLHIADNPNLRSVAAALVYLERPQGPYYRPLVFLSYALERLVWGAAPLGYHVVNLALHIANLLLLLHVASRGGVHPAGALIGAAVFALHPVQTEAVAYVSGRTDLLMTAGALLSWTALCGPGPALARGVGAAAAGVIAMLSKESGYALVLLWPWLAWRHGRGMRERLALVAPGVLAALLLLVLRPDAAPSGAALGLRQLAGLGQALAVYASLLVWPAHLQIDRLTLLPSGASAMAGGLLVLAVAFVLAAWGLSRRGAAADWTAWTIAFYLPAANLLAIYPAISEQALFTPEHNLYAPLAGIAVLVGIGIARAGAHLSPVQRRVGGAVILAALALCTLRTAIRCFDWHDEERLFGAAVAAGSHSPRVWFNYGNALLRRRADVRASEVFAGGAQRAPRDARMWENLGVALHRQRAYVAAERAYRRAVELAPGEAQIFENLGSLYAAQGNLHAARAAFTAALRLDPGRATARTALHAIEQIEQR